MTEISKRCQEYFSSLNPIAKKISREVKYYQKTFGEEWESFSPQKQEEIIDKHFVSSELTCKYADHGKERPATFPVYRINNGEKIIVDFLDGCETWRDEHSGPFSWKTRSQQNLTLDELDEEDRKASRCNKYSKSPEQEAPGSAGVRSEYPTWERTGYQTAEQEKNETEEEIFRKFGITFSTSHSDNEEIPVDQEDSAEPPLTPKDGYKNYAYADTSFEGIDDSSDEKPEAEQALISGPSPNISLPDSAGHISPVFINDQGESSTDKFDFNDVTITLQPKSTNVEPTSVQSDWKSTLLDDHEDSHGESTAPTTGFDFLDNW
ncbi:hypothetical protein CAPTEDRAFT_187947 [Capitella teleta]|uniref:DUF4706 domain-containing protein n=1 Tax=Capitella teleta TaxID=283909 RepID=R7U4S8_CAPTE|nr:hypothetical protein CAPTEDRAFT_187947 [Capitella teleta]|eukprot:ELU01121.1 hypothetical protein CAPTEDRAFT_187947 [Capitella teleta]